ncbi:MAG TPA: PilZ domain-containing protein [Spirochaetota bacterium]|nr:PilZ domain-containing protein [Spirochaetota bacterium]HPS87088.1 PilZ domain-containing protein [Spirochaetota bacterium]
MGDEKRRYERIVIPGEVLINHRDFIIQCWIENISNYGAYLKVGSPINLQGIEIGDNVTFSITTPNIATRELSGRILRRSMEGENVYLAVYFIEPYTFG